MRRRMTVWLAAAALLAAGRAAPTLLAPESPPPWTWSGLAGCESAERSADQWRPYVLNADRYLDATFRCDGLLVAGHVAEYFGQRPGKEAVGGANRVSDDDPGAGSILDASVSGLGFDVNVYSFVNGRGDDVIVWQWYAIGAEPIASAGRAKMAEARRLLVFEPLSSTQFLVAAIGDSNEAEALVRSAAESLWAAFLEQRP